MKKSDLQILVDQGLSTRQIGRECGKSQTTVRYWLQKHNLRVVRTSTSDFRCRMCGTTDPDKFYEYRKKLCGDCDNKRVKRKAEETRERVIAHLGGECQACGYSRYSCALDVHHLDPSEKDPGFSNMRYWSWERIEKELANCVLLCKNCHSAVHFGDLEL